MSITPAERDELRRLAETATRTVWTESDYDVVRNAVATLSPATVTRLLTALEAAEAREAALRELIETTVWALPNWDALRLEVDGSIVDRVRAAVLDAIRGAFLDEQP